MTTQKERAMLVTLGLYETAWIMNYGKVRGTKYAFNDWAAIATMFNWTNLLGLL